MNTRQLLRTTWRRKGWLFRRLSLRGIANLLTAGVAFAFKRETTPAMPAVVKIDISPVCNLSCTMCVHADANGSDLIAEQHFSPSQHMSVERFTEIIDQVKGKTTSVSLYTWGDPLVHPELPTLCRIAAEAGLQVHISTNYSFKLSDERIRALVDSGLSHLTVCVDGLTQENYEKTRVGGRIEWVLDNLERTTAYRRKKGTKLPLIEVQYIKYQHNLEEAEPARELCEGFGVNQVSTFWGALHNLADVMPGNVLTKGPKPDGALPGCYWPHFSMVIKFNGDVIPCCEHRGAAQYAPGADQRTLGNVFETSVAQVWNSQAYQTTRRLVNNPTGADDDPETSFNYCRDCFVIYDTNIGERRRWGNKHKFEDVFDKEPGKRPVRKPSNVTGLPS
ncbi:MAG: SPASM domain-containing protein [Deltaproteobacteria bacterium]|nr:SPASM domain-containing protein [Deltaproteobacteria bacterium]